MVYNEMDKSTAEMVEDAEKLAGSPPPAAAQPVKRSWYRNPWLWVGVGVALATVIIVPTAVVVSNNAKNSSVSSVLPASGSTSTGGGNTSNGGSGSTTPTNSSTTPTTTDPSTDDGSGSSTGNLPAGMLSCTRKDGTKLTVSYSDVGITAGSSVLDKVSSDGAKTYPSQPVPNIGTARQLDYTPQATGPYSGSPLCSRPSIQAPNGQQQFQPYLPCVLTSDPVDLQSNYYLSRSASTSERLGAALTSLFHDAEDAVTDDHVYTVTKKKNFPPIQNPKDPHTFYHPAPYYFPDPTCVDPVTGQKNATACPYIHCDSSIQNPESRAVRDDKELSGMIAAVTSLAYRAYFAGAEFKIKGPDSNSTVYSSKRKTPPTFSAKPDGSGVLVSAGDVAADQARFIVKAQQVLSTMFLSPNTYLAPNFNFAGYAHGYPMEGAFFSGFTDLISLVDAMAILESLPAWNTTRAGVDGQNGVEITQGLRKWFTDLYTWHVETPGTMKDQARINNIGTWVDAVWVSVAHYAGYKSEPKTILDLVPKRRIMVQVAPTGEMIRETTRANSYGYTTFAIRALTTLASQADRYAAGAANSASTKGVSGLWTWFDNGTKSNSSSLQRAVDFSLPYVPGLETSLKSGISNLTGKPFEIVNKPWPFPQDKLRDNNGIEYIRDAYYALGGSQAESNADAGLNTRRYRVAFEEGMGMLFTDWNDVRRLGEPAQ